MNYDQNGYEIDPTPFPYFPDFADEDDVVDNYADDDEEDMEALMPPEPLVANAGGRIAIHPSENSDMLVTPPNMAFIVNERAKELDAEQAKRARRR